MLIPECIAELLMTRESVVLPGFGTLRSEEVSASIHPGENSFHPPAKRIYFDHSLTSDDQAIQEWLEKNKGLSAMQADTELKNFLRELMSALKDKGAYEVEGIGKFYYDIERRLQFHPQAGRNFLMDAYGLPEFVSKPVLRPENIPAYSVQKPVEEKKKRKFIWFRF